MKFCINYQENPNFKYFDDVAEIEWIYNGITSELIDKFKSWNYKRIIIRILNSHSITDVDLKKFAFLKESFPFLNFAFSLPKFLDTDSRTLFKQIKDLGYDVFFHSLCTNWTTLTAMKDFGVSDIYLAEDICFELKDAAKVLHEQNIKIRIFPNISQTCAMEGDISSLKTFFVRPEDLLLYEPYVDIIEFFNATERINIYYKIYAEDKQWPDNLGLLIQNLNMEIPNQSLSQLFGERRINCNKKCFKGKGCHVCEHMIELAKTMNDHGLIYSYEAKEQ